MLHIFSLFIWVSLKTGKVTAFFIIHLPIYHFVIFLSSYASKKIFEYFCPDLPSKRSEWPATQQPWEAKMKTGGFFKAHTGQINKDLKLHFSHAKKKKSPPLL